MERRKILIIEDTPEHRIAVCEAIREVLSGSWELDAPDKLEVALSRIETDRDVKIVILDNNLNSNGFQEMGAHGDYENFRGWQVAKIIARERQDIAIMSYSVTGGYNMVDTTNNHFRRKNEVLSGTKDAIKELQRCVTEIIGEIEKRED